MIGGKTVKQEGFTNETAIETRVVDVERGFEATNSADAGV
jgi:hypothetical protein